LGLIALIIGGAFMLFGASMPFRATRGWRRLVAALAGISVIAGAIGFFGAFLSAAGGLNWLPRSFEWPAGYCQGIITLQTGVHVVPHGPANRIQLYDDHWRFIRGWHVNAFGGTFSVRAGSDDLIEVYTARRQQRYTFALNGDFIAQSSYAPASYSSFMGGVAGAVPTAPWLWVFSSPATSGAAIVLGILLFNLAQWRAAVPGADSGPTGTVQAVVKR
jgi:hypothetical protein